MAVVNTAVGVLHLLFAGLWTGAVAFVAWQVVPLFRDGDLGVEPGTAIISGLRGLSRASALVLLLTGGHLAASRYTAATLFGSGRGHLVLTMVALWLVLTGLVEVASGRALDELEAGRLRTAGETTATLFAAAAVVALLLLVVAGLLA